MQSCYSGWRVGISKQTSLKKTVAISENNLNLAWKIQVDACGEGYDFTSVMHYSLKSFAIDYNQNTVTPKDSSITEAGNTQLSAGDVKKLQCM